MIEVEWLVIAAIVLILVTLIANAAISEAADRLEQLQKRCRNQRRELEQLKGK